MNMRKPMPTPSKSSRTARIENQRARVRKILWEISENCKQVQKEGKGTLRKLDAQIVSQDLYQDQMDQTTDMVREIEGADSNVLSALFEYKLKGKLETDQAALECLEDYQVDRLDPNSKLAKIERLERVNKATNKAK